MNRRQFAAGSAAALVTGLFPVLGRGQAGLDPARLLADAWTVWKQRHLAPSGRVVDGPQGGTSHSEGQGYGLTLAALMRDGDAVDRIVAWTDANLAIRDDGLLAWRWFPERADPVPDRNNASDGDLFFAWGCLLAGRALGRGALVERAIALTRALADTCVADDPRGGGRVLFIPAVEGFLRPRSMVVNPSYVMPMAMRDLAAAGGVPILDEVASDALGLLGELAASGTTPDWIMVTPTGLTPSADLSDRTGYEAIRVPLFLVWSGEVDHPMVARHRAVTLAARPAPFDAPTVFDRTSGAVLERSGDLGYLALAGLAGCPLAEARLGADWPGIPPFGAPQPYYPATLHMMAFVAQTARYPACLPV